MKFSLHKLPYYFVKFLLYLLGIGRITGYWEQLQVFKRVKKKLYWAYSDYSLYDKPICTNIPNKVIWVYWRQGIDKAPEIVKRCVKSVVEHNRDYVHIILDEQNLHQYIELPDYIEKKHNEGKISEAQLSDMIRLQLLILYGGIWMDATCFNSSDIPKVVLNSDFFMFSSGNWWPEMNDVTLCSSWFIKSGKNNILLKRVRNFMFEQWKKNNKPMHYFIFHIALSALVDYDQECREMWDRIPFISNLNPHLFMYSFDKDYNVKEYEYILSQCFIHKCTYRFSESLLDYEKENNLQHFLSTK